MLEKKDYTDIIFTLVFRYLKKKNRLYDYLKYSYEYHSVFLNEYKLPEGISSREKTEIILGHNVNEFIKSSKFIKREGVPFLKKIKDFFVSYEGSFVWIETGMQDIWYALDMEWRDSYLVNEVTELIKKGVNI